MGLIYKVTNKINNKVYIGQTRQSIMRRWHAHINAAYNENCYSVKFHNAIKKYGENNFIIECIEDNIPLELLNEREIYYINKYDSYNNGYNSTFGGDGCEKIDYSNVLVLWNNGYTCSEIARQIKCLRTSVSDILKNFGLTENDFKQRAINKASYNVKQYTLNNVLIAEFKSINEAARQTGLHASGIQNAVKGKYKSCGGYIWKSDNINIKKYEKSEHRQKKY